MKKKEMGSDGGWSGSVWAKVKKNGRRKGIKNGEERGKKIRSNKWREVGSLKEEEKIK